MIDLLINGEWREGTAGCGVAVDPATGRASGEIAFAGPADVAAAIAAARDAFDAWSRRPARERGAVLARAGEILAGRVRELAPVMTLDQGKTVAEAEAELRRAVETLRWNGHEADRIEGRELPGGRHTLPAPVGVVAAITAWNFPAVLIARKVAAALAAGCTVVLKASEQAPRIAAEVVRAFTDAGVPPGAVNLVFGEPPRIAARLLDSPDVAALTFTGSTRVGRRLATRAGAGLKRMVLELGGHAPVIVGPDADVADAVAKLVPAKFGSAGQSCVAPSRCFVHAARYDEFCERFSAAAAAIVVGPGSREDVDMGPLISEARVVAMERLTRDATDRGATLLTGGVRPRSAGFFFAPTVLRDVPDDAVVMHEEPFGPIAPIAAYDDLADALRRANRPPYGLAGYVFANDRAVLERAVRELRVGSLGVNRMAPSPADAPLGGMRDSGLGYEGGRAGIEAFLHFRLIHGDATR